MLAKTLKYAGIGFLIGIVVGYVIAILTSADSPNLFIPVSEKLLNFSGGSIPLAMTLQGLFSGLYGAVCFAGIVFYEIERLPLAAATTLHCLLIILLYPPIALFLGWAEEIGTLLIIAAIQIVAFFIIWLIMYLKWKAEVRQLNELQMNLPKTGTE